MSTIAMPTITKFAVVFGFWLALMRLVGSEHKHLSRYRFPIFISKIFLFPIFPFYHYCYNLDFYIFQFTQHNCLLLYMIFDNICILLLLKSTYCRERFGDDFNNQAEVKWTIKIVGDFRDISMWNCYWHQPFFAKITGTVI